MKKPGYSFKTNLVYGLVVIVPLAVLVLLIAKVVEILQTIALSLKLETTVGAGLAIVIALLLLLLVCLGIGAMVRTKIGTCPSRNSSRQFCDGCQATSCWEISSRDSRKRGTPTRRCWCICTARDPRCSAW